MARQRARTVLLVAEWGRSRLLVRIGLQLDGMLSQRVFDAAAMASVDPFDHRGLEPRERPHVPHPVPRVKRAGRLALGLVALEKARHEELLGEGGEAHLQALGAGRIRTLLEVVAAVVRHPNETGHGLGPLGDGSHAPDEHVIASSVEPRSQVALALLAAVLLPVV